MYGEQQLSLHNHIISIFPEVACLMRCSVVIPSAVLLVDSQADYTAVASWRRLFFWAADAVVMWCTIADDSVLYRPDTWMSLFQLAAELAWRTKCYDGQREQQHLSEADRQTYTGLIKLWERTVKPPFVDFFTHNLFLSALLSLFTLF